MVCELLKLPSWCACSGSSKYRRGFKGCPLYSALPWESCDELIMTEGRLNHFDYAKELREKDYTAFAPEWSRKSSLIGIYFPKKSPPGMGIMHKGLIVEG